jgi:hypothetical protein
MRIRILAMTAALGAVMPASANDRVALKVTPWVSFAPADLYVRATVDQHQDNRAIQIIAESDDFYRSSEVELPGQRAPRTTMIEFRSLPSGEYNVRAIVKGTNGRAIAMTQQTIKVVETGALR